MDRQRKFNGVVGGNIPDDIHEDVRGASPGAVRESFHGGEKGITLGGKRGDNPVGVRETIPSSAIMHEPMYDPPVPFMQRVGGLCPNNIVFIAGHINQNPKRVTINLQCGNDVIAFHFDIRFNYGSPRNVIVRNTNKNGWGPEERSLQYGPFPFKPDNNFEIIILTEINCFKVAVNNQHLLEYKHRVQPLHRIDTLSIVGDLRLTQDDKTFLSEMDCQRKNNGDVKDVVPYPAVSGFPIYDPTVPFVQNIGGLYPDNIIFIAGVPNPNPCRFTIYLQSGVHYEPQQIAMAFDARFVFGNDRHCIVRNHKYSNKWGMEERFAPYFPFRLNTYFEIIILVTPHCFKVAVNNRHVLEFKHRLLPLNLVDYLHIAGDVSLSQYVRSGYDDVKYPDARGVPIYNPPTPFVQNTGRLNPNKMIFICGIPDPEASRFSVNLQNGPHADSELVAMAFDVRFMWGDPVSENCVVCNHKDGEYKDIDEERHSTFFPFKRNKMFEMIILVEARCFKVAVNNKHFIEFKHKIKPLSSIDTLSITGDVRLTQVRFQE